MAPPNDHVQKIRSFIPVIIGLSCSLSLGCAAVWGIEDFTIDDDAGTAGDILVAHPNDGGIPESEADALSGDADAGETSGPPVDAAADVNGDASIADASGDVISTEDAWSEDATDDSADVWSEDGSSEDANAADVTMGDVGPDSVDDAGQEAPDDAALDAWEEDAPVESDAGTDSAADASSEDGGGCPVVLTDEATMVLVATYGADVPACGEVALPCRTVAVGIERAAALGKPTVAIAAGEYEEEIALRAGIGLRGGWQPSPSDPWMADCTEQAAELVVLRAPSNASVGVIAEDLGGEASLEVLTILSKDSVEVGAGESVYGVVARGASTLLNLDQVIVEATGPGAGTDGLDGELQPSGLSGCSPEDGSDGAAGADALPVDAGDFTAAGYSSPFGWAGTPGSSGAAGTPGEPGGCVECVACSFAGKKCKTSALGDSCGTPGLSGCGGLGGVPGQGGGGGGSSVALYAWDAVVTVWGGLLVAGDGAAGGHGGAGELGGLGGLGSPGLGGIACTTTCSIDEHTCIEHTEQGPGGTAGGPGGTGGRGGDGGGGPGGHSFTIVAGGSANVGISTTTELLFGSPGAGADGAGNGKAGVWWP